MLEALEGSLAGYHCFGVYIRTLIVEVCVGKWDKGCGNCFVLFSIALICLLL